MEITEHQANMLRALADGKKLEVVHEKTAPGKWFEIQTIDNFMLFISSPDWYEVRIKPDVIVVNGIEMPAPERRPLERGDIYYVPCPLMKSYCAEFVWSSDMEDDMRFLERGLVYRDRDNAAARGEEMLAHKPG